MSNREPTKPVRPCRTRGGKKQSLENRERCGGSPEKTEVSVVATLADLSHLIIDPAWREAHRKSVANPASNPGRRWAGRE